MTIYDAMNSDIDRLTKERDEALAQLELQKPVVDAALAFFAECDGRSEAVLILAVSNYISDLQEKETDAIVSELKEKEKGE